MRSIGHGLQWFTEYLLLIYKVVYRNCTEEITDNLWIKSGQLQTLERTVFRRTNLIPGT